MYVRCTTTDTHGRDACGRMYDDAKQWTICPHNPLDVAAEPAAFCWRCDLRAPCLCPDGIPTR